MDDPSTPVRVVSPERLGAYLYGRPATNIIVQGIQS
jgi:hypothetical protein